jgi:hypothetical protein
MPRTSQNSPTLFESWFPVILAVTVIATVVLALAAALLGPAD